MVTKRSIALFFIVISCTYFFIIYINDSLETKQIQNASFLNPEIKSNSYVTEKKQIMEDFKYQEPVKIGVREHILQPKDNKTYGFYTSVGGGKVFSDNSEVFVGGIKEIGKRVKDLVKEDSYFSAFIKRVIAIEIDNINQFKGKINFQWLGSASLGYHAKENGRVDFEVMYFQMDIENSGDTSVFDKSASIFAFLLNLYYNPSIKNTQFAPYVSLGIGPTIFRLKKVNKSPQDPMPLNVPWFAYQAKFGVDYSIIPEMNLFLGYRYFSIPIPVADDITTHSIEVGLRFNF